MTKLSPYGYVPHDKIQYISNITRSMVTMIDLVILIFSLYALSYYVIFPVVYTLHPISLELLEKYTFNLEMSDAELQSVHTYYFIMFVIQVVQLLILIMFFVYCWCRFATTPGGFLFGIRVVDADSLGKITLKQATIRSISTALSILPAFLGIIWALFDKRSQALHDKLANTVLIVKNLKC